MKNYIILVDDYDYTASALLVTDKPECEVQELIDRVKSEHPDDYDYDMLSSALKEAGVEIIESNSKVYW